MFDKWQTASVLAKITPATFISSLFFSSVLLAQNNHFYSYPHTNPNPNSSSMASAYSNYYPHLNNTPQVNPPFWLNRQNQNRGSQSWQNWLNNFFQNGQWQQGDGNVFQDAKGFYKLMGNGRTKWKFYFDVDFQAQMDAWMRGNGQNKNQQHRKINGNGLQQLNGQGQPFWGQQGQYWQNNRLFYRPYYGPRNPTNYSYPYYGR